MDRFIDCVKSDLQYDLLNLKSNMDRFIALTSFTDALTNVHLKSNMDRFIDRLTKEPSLTFSI